MATQKYSGRNSLGGEENIEHDPRWKKKKMENMLLDKKWIGHPVTRLPSPAYLVDHDKFIKIL